jgi:LPXTG-motif cell wall-anchored protein
VIPTAGNWGMSLLGLAFLGAMAWMLRARRRLKDNRKVQLDRGGSDARSSVGKPAW